MIIPLQYILVSVILLTVNVCKFFGRASVASEKNFWGVQGFWPMYRGKWELCTGILLK